MATPAPTTGSLRLRPGQLAACLGVGAAAFSVWFFPIVLGLIAVALGVTAMVRGEPRGRWVILLAVVCVPIGLIVAYIPDDVIGS